MRQRQIPYAAGPQARGSDGRNSGRGTESTSTPRRTKATISTTPRLLSAPEGRHIAVTDFIESGLTLLSCSADPGVAPQGAPFGAGRQLPPPRRHRLPAPTPRPRTALGEARPDRCCSPSTRLPGPAPDAPADQASPRVRRHAPLRGHRGSSRARVGGQGENGAPNEREDTAAAWPRHPIRRPAARHALSLTRGNR